MLLDVPRDTPEIYSRRAELIMRFCDLLTAFDEALEWALEDPLLADHLPPHLSSDDPWNDARSTAHAA